MNPATFTNRDERVGGLGGRLVAAGILNKNRVIAAEREARKLHSSFIRYLIDTLGVDSKALAEMASAEYGIPVFDVKASTEDPSW